jgi:hypothetical protein
MTTLRIHRDVYPKTDHGYTWVECIWFERDGKTVSPLIPSAGCCERLMNMPGGPIRCNVPREEQIYAPDGVERVEKSESVHDDCFYRVGTVCITPRD